MVRALRAFVWLRWRVFINALERTTARDTLERLSVATEKLGPILTLVLLIPSATGLFLFGMIGGFGLGVPSWRIPVALVRYFLLFATVMTVFGPIVLSSRDAGNVVRFLLLPIRRLALYIAQMAGAFADPWILLTTPVLIGVPLGALVGGHPVIAALTLVAGIGMLLVVVGLTSLTSTIIHLLLRNRRRGDLVMLFVVLILPLIGLIPAMLGTDHAFRERGRRQAHQSRGSDAPTMVSRAAHQAFRVSPSELYHDVGVAAAADPRAAIGPLAGLGALAFIIQFGGFVAFKRMLDMPVSLGARRGAALGGLWGRRIPGLSASASAVAFTQLRLAMRTPRGRSILAGPILIFMAFAVMFYRSGIVSIPLPVSGGLGLATFGCFVCLFSILPLAMNQFAIDKAGFTRYMLSPVSVGELLQGKAVGNALIGGGPAAFCFVVAALVFRGGHPSLWLALFLSMIATYVLVAPAAAALSATFPRTVDLNSIGHASNAHQAAALLGLLAFFVAAAPCAVLVLVATGLLHRPSLAPIFLAVWCALALVIARLLFGPVRKLVAARCEALAQYY